jgi:mono/diheme cytochrome c family protein
MKLAVFLVAVSAAGALLQEEPARTTQDGVYTTEQADRGKDGYAESCAGCHPLDWYRGAAIKPWNGAPLFNLYDAIATTMPQSNPGSLKPREYVDLLAYILSLNDMPAGTEALPTNPDGLKKILIKWRDKP